MTMSELIDRLCNLYNTEELVELLEIPSDQLLERFDDYLQDNWEKAVEATE